MAIDTTQKLVSALRKTLPFPSGAIIDNGDLQHIIWNYAGILADDSLPEFTGIPVRIYNSKTRVFVFSAKTRGPLV